MSLLDHSGNCRSILELDTASGLLATSKLGVSGEHQCILKEIQPSCTELYPVAMLLCDTLTLGTHENQADPRLTPMGAHEPTMVGDCGSSMKEQEFRRDI